MITQHETIGIAEARRLLSKWGIEWDRPELLELAGKLRKRRPKYPVARAERKRLNPELAERIRKFKADHPLQPNWKIGLAFGTDAARVSEAIHNKDKERK